MANGGVPVEIPMDLVPFHLRMPNSEFFAVLDRSANKIVAIEPYEANAEGTESKGKIDKDDLDSVSQSSNNRCLQSGPRFDWTLIGFQTIAIVAFVSPHILIPLAGIYWAAASAIGIWLLWCNTMPVSCINGGMIYSFFAMIIFLNTVAMVLGAIVGVVVLFT